MLAFLFNNRLMHHLSLPYFLPKTLKCPLPEKGNFRFVSLQSKVGQSLLLRSGKRSNDTSSIVLATSTGAFFKSDAVMRIARGLDGENPILGIVGQLGPIFPKRFRDAVYNYVAENRFVFGESDQCRLYDDRFDDRFVPDSLEALWNGQ